MLSNREIRLAARQALKGKWGIMVAATVIYYLITFVGSLIPLIGWLAVLICSGPLVTGLIWLALAISRNEEHDLGYLFSGFKDFGRTLAAYLLICLFTFLWSLLLLVPGIIKTYSYSQTFFILRDDPNISALDAITASREMMDGYKGKLFGLSLSIGAWLLIPYALVFIGITTGVAASVVYSNSYSDFPVVFIIIGFLVAGLGYLAFLALLLFISPYLLMALAVFYDDRQMQVVDNSEGWSDVDLFSKEEEASNPFDSLDDR